jgi:hypothetical protein
MNQVRKILAGGAIAAAAITGGAIGASFIGTAGAQTATTSPSDATATTPSDGSAAATPPTDAAGRPAAPPAGQQGQPPQAPDWSKGGHQANGKTETLLTGDDLTKATAAAEAAVPGATAQRAETDAEGAAYEVHMTKSDGSIVTVKLDSNFAVTGVDNGMA